MMLWHKIFHRVTEIRYISVSHPTAWLCSCGKEWRP